MKTYSSIIVLAAICGIALADESKSKQEAPTGAATGALIGAVAGNILQEQEAAARQKQTEEALAKLAGTDWRLVRIGEKESAEGVTSSLSFKADGSVSGRAGVNRYSGAFKMENGKLKTGPFITTRMAGKPEAMKQESAFMAALSAVRALVLVEGKLVIKSGCECNCAGDCAGGCKTCGDACGCNDGCKPKLDLVLESNPKE